MGKLALDPSSYQPGRLIVTDGTAPGTLPDTGPSPQYGYEPDQLRINPGMRAATISDAQAATAAGHDLAAGPHFATAGYDGKQQDNDGDFDGGMAE